MSVSGKVVTSATRMASTQEATKSSMGGVPHVEKKQKKDKKQKQPKNKQPEATSVPLFGAVKADKELEDIFGKSVS